MRYAGLSLFYFKDISVRRKSVCTSPRSATCAAKRGFATTQRLSTTHAVIGTVRIDQYRTDLAHRSRDRVGSFGGKFVATIVRLRITDRSNVCRFTGLDVSHRVANEYEPI
jgi:hypothetical protein